MTDPVPQSQVDAANAYEALFVPALFHEWAPRVLAAVRPKPGDRVLDVACGTGVLAREAATALGAAASVAGVDASPGMLAVARQLAPAIDWRHGMAESLPYADRAFDAIVSQFALMFFTDREQAVREMLRVLAPGGRVAVAVWDRLDTMPAYTTEVSLLERLAGRQAADALRAPFVLGDSDALAALFADAGLSSVAVATERGEARFPSIRSMVEADLRGWLPVMGVELGDALIERILEQAERDLAPYRSPDNSARFATSAHIVTARRD